MSSLLPHPPRQGAKTHEDSNGKNKAQKVWIQRDGQLSAVVITKGISDGLMTEVTGGDLEPGWELVTDMETVK